MNHLRFSYLIINLWLSGLFSQSIEVKGTIADYESQHPLVGVNIVVGEFGTTSDETGSFFLTVNDGTEISFSFIGYEKINTIVKRLHSCKSCQFFTHCQKWQNSIQLFFTNMFPTQ